MRRTILCTLRIVLGGISLLAALWLLAIAAVPVAAHDWYEKTKSPSGALCCGGNDCDQVPDNAVKEVTGGFHVVAEVKGVHVDHVFAYSEMQPSPDRKWHVCVLSYEGAPPDYRCFFGPLPTF
jgi:hypothetical protein